jgi:hypothetical protein
MIQDLTGDLSRTLWKSVHESPCFPDSNRDLDMCEAQEKLEWVIARMQAIQRAIKASGQPASMFELQELKDLGREYALIIDSLTEPPGGPPLA